MKIMTFEYEPTLHDVIHLMQGMELRLSTVAQENFRFLSDRIDNLDQRMIEMQRILHKTVLGLEDVRDNLSTTKENTSRTFTSHEKRIKKLETRFV